MAKLTYKITRVQAFPESPNRSKAFSLNILASYIVNEFTTPPETDEIIEIYGVRVVEKKDKTGWHVFMPSTQWTKEKPKTFPFVRVVQKEDYDNLVALLSVWADQQEHP